jgi:hypothetical protein
MTQDSELASYDYLRIKEKLDNLLLAIASKLDREPLQRAKHPESEMILQALARVAANTFHTIRFFSAEEPTNHARRIEYVVNAPALMRTMVDVIATIVFLFEDLPTRTEWYLKSGWKEFVEHRNRYRLQYGADPSWSQYLLWLDRRVSEAKALAGISVAEELGTVKIARFPIPSTMVTDKNTAADRVDFLRYLYDWYYREFSQDTHLSWPGLVRRAAPLLERRRTDGTSAYLMKLRSDVFSTSITLLLAMLSELEIETTYGLAERIRELWNEMLPVSAEAQEIHAMRYAGRL